MVIKTLHKTTEVQVERQGDLIVIVGKPSGHLILSESLADSLRFLLGVELDVRPEPYDQDAEDD